MKESGRLKKKGVTRTVIRENWKEHEKRRGRELVFVKLNVNIKCEIFCFFHSCLAGNCTDMNC